MGFDLNLFVEKVDQKLICRICQKVYEDPMQCQQCSNVFCRECIHNTENILSSLSNKKCPECKQQSQMKEALELNNLILSLQAKCTDKNCQQVFKLEKLLSHLEQKGFAVNVAKDKQLQSIGTCQPSKYSEKVENGILQSSCQKCLQALQYTPNKTHICLDSLVERVSRMQDYERKIDKLLEQNQILTQRVENLENTLNQDLDYQNQIKKLKEEISVVKQYNRSQNIQLPNLKTYQQKEIQTDSLEEIQEQSQQLQVQSQNQHIEKNKNTKENPKQTTNKLLTKFGFRKKQETNSNELKDYNINISQQDSSNKLDLTFDSISQMGGTTISECGQIVYFKDGEKRNCYIDYLMQEKKIYKIMLKVKEFQFFAFGVCKQKIYKKLFIETQYGYGYSCTQNLEKLQIGTSKVHNNDFQSYGIYVKQGDTVQIQINRLSGEIEYQIKNQNCGLAFKENELTQGNLWAVVGGSFASIEILNAFEIDTFIS